MSCSTAPRFWTYEQVIQNENPRHCTRREGRIQLSKSDRSAIRESQEDYRLVISEPIPQEQPRPLGFAWLAVELTIGIE